MNKKAVLITIITTLYIFQSCLSFLDTVSGVSIDDIKKRGKLKAIVRYNPSSYFLYRGTPMGFEYELLKRLSNELEVELELIVKRDTGRLVHSINSEDADIIASGQVVTKKLARQFDFTEHLLTTRQVLIQQKPATISNPIELIGKTVSVFRGSPFDERVNHLSEEIGGDINLQYLPPKTTRQQLFDDIVSGKIKLTVVEESLALVEKTYRQEIHSEVALSFPQRVAWVVRNQSFDLLKYLNEWINKRKNDGTIDSLYKKYFVTHKSQTRLQSPFHSITGGKISPFDQLYKKNSELIDWDWKMLAALSYQESRFKPTARSWAGARGLMQLMPATARRFGVKKTSSLFNPEINITTGTKFLKELIKEWEIISNKEERLNFILSSYNAGPGHIRDARALAIAEGDDANKWSVVREYVLKLSDPEWYNRSEVKHGYCRGREPYEYVEAIHRWYKHYNSVPTI